MQINYLQHTDARTKYGRTDANKLFATYGRTAKCEEFLRNLRTKKYKNEKDLLIKMRRISSQLENQKYKNEKDLLIKMRRISSQLENQKI
jgi:hypothetical protein